MPRRAPRVCSRSGCPNLTDKGRCSVCRAEAERARGTAAQRGYGSQHRARFRAAVLARDPVCVLCRTERSVHADHWPRDKRELISLGLDSNNPEFGRGLCHPCHSKITAQEQPGGWNSI